MWESILWFFLSPLLKWLTGYILVGVIGIGIFLLLPGRNLPIVGEVSRRVANIAGIVGVIALLSGAHAAYFFKSGEKHSIQRMAARDAKVIQRVQVKQIEVDSCNDALDWDVTTGTCNRSK